MTNRRKSRNKRQQKKIEKALNNTTRDQRQATTQKGTAGLEAIRKLKDVLKPYELTRSRRFSTYMMMLTDDAVYSSWSTRANLIAEAQHNGRLKYDKTNEQASQIAKYLRHCMSQMDYQTPRSIAACASEMIFNTFAPFEMVTKEGKMDFEGYHVLKKLSYIAPLTLDPLKPYEVVKGGDELAIWNQRSSAFVNTDGTNGSYTGGNWGKVPIDARKVAVAGYGTATILPDALMSCFDAAYDAWCEKRLINEFLIVGVQKDMSGIPIFEAPQQFFDDAAEVGSEAFIAMEEIKAQLGNLHAGEQSFMFFPSDTHSETGQGAKLYNLTFKGIEGGGKAFTLDELIVQKNQAIHKALGSLNLNSAEQGTASYNSLEGQTNLQFHYVKADNRIIDEMWNKQVFPFLMRLNKEKFGDVDPDIMPKWEHGEVQKLSIKEFGKFVQQTKLYLPRTPEVVNHILEMGGFDVNVNTEMTQEELSELMPEFDSRDRSGESNGSSGFGDNDQSGVDSVDTEE
ncbi:hypothetical protein KUA24_93 [Vibrio phage HNL01]|nr:hypothetical protein KUA24_93 [Vibrio phage HNL01]